MVQGPVSSQGFGVARDLSDHSENTDSRTRGAGWDVNNQKSYMFFMWCDDKGYSKFLPQKALSLAQESCPGSENCA